MKILITGSLGLIGSTTAQFFLHKKHQVMGIDNDMRQKLFGRDGSVSSQTNQLLQYPHYQHRAVDIRHKNKISELVADFKPDAIIHCAGQPSHDLAANIPLVDFKINALGTLHLLEAVRQHQPQANFIFMSTNKVYGDAVNEIPLMEKKKRYVYRRKNFAGVSESFPIDQTLHSLMGASKIAADIYVQEYGRYYGLKTSCLRLGCVTGTNHAGVKMHGFLSYLVKSLVKNNSYQIIGYQGKQVRDQIHAIDVARAIHEIIKKPKKGEVYNLGGGWQNNASILELIDLISQKIGISPQISYQDLPRKGDHIVYISDIRKFEKDYPKWDLKLDLETIVNQLIDHENASS